MFTKAEFLSNEDNNYHTENGIEMANHFGTEGEQRLMMQIQKDHYARGHINPDEIEARMGIVKKYWHMLESVKEAEADDLYHDNVKKVGQKDYNDYKGIQIHNLEKELKQVRKILLNLQDIESKDNSSDMVNDIRNMLGGYQDLLDSMESAFDKLRTGRHRKESVKEDDEERGAEHYREKDKQHTDHVKAELEEIMSHLDQAITYRWENSHLFFNNGDKAGAGEMYRMADKLKELHAGWDKSTELYGM